MPYFIQPNLVQEKFNYVQYIEKNGGKICRISTFFVSTDQNSALSLVAPCSVCQEKLKFVIVDSSTRRSNSIIISRILVQFLLDYKTSKITWGVFSTGRFPVQFSKRKQATTSKEGLSTIENCKEREFWLRESHFSFQC